MTDKERAGSRASNRTAGGTSLDSKGNPKPSSRRASVMEQLYGEEEDGTADPQRSWTLDHVTEIVHLATQIQMTEQIEAALTEMEGGKDDALQVHRLSATVTIPHYDICL